jgi:hypothetical protein
MKILPPQDMRVHLANDGIVLVAMHEHCGGLWWTKLARPLEGNVGCSDLERVVIDFIDRRAVV